MTTIIHHKAVRISSEVKAGPGAGKKTDLFYFSKNQPPQKKSAPQSGQECQHQSAEQEWPEVPKQSADWGLVDVLQNLTPRINEKLTALEYHDTLLQFVETVYKTSQNCFFFSFFGLASAGKMMFFSCKLKYHTEYNFFSETYWSCVFWRKNYVIIIHQRAAMKCSQFLKKTPRWQQRAILTSCQEELG